MMKNLGLVENYYDLDLSVEFLSQLFKYVDELCEYINNGDQNGNRSSVVIQNLNYAVSCYRVNLPNPDEVIKGQLISKRPFDVFESPKKPMKFFPGFLP